jgi:NAD-dependent DNA ligase
MSNGRVVICPVENHVLHSEWLASAQRSPSVQPSGPPHSGTPGTLLERVSQSSLDSAFCRTPFSGACKARENQRIKGNTHNRRRGKGPRFRVFKMTATPDETLVVTGTLKKYTRDEIEKMFVRHGGRAASSVLKNTDYVVAGEKAGSDLDKAKQLGVTVLSEEPFENLLT